MPRKHRNIYKIGREDAGLTQERASELIDISVESLRAYENNIRIPPDPVVIRMIEIYDARYLAYQHLKTSAEVGRKYMPDIELKDLPMAILNLQKAVADYLKVGDEVIDIVYDGVIDKEERPRWETILQMLDKISEAILTLKFAKE